MRTAVMQALLEEWRSELARKPLVMSEREACAVLGVQQEEGGQTQEGPLSEDALKAAYRSVMTTISLYYDITNHLLLLCLSVFSRWVLSMLHLLVLLVCTGLCEVRKICEFVTVKTVKLVDPIEMRKTGETRLVLHIPSSS